MTTVEAPHSRVSNVIIKESEVPAREPRLGVFADNASMPIHRWYPFVEGYSSDLVARALMSADANTQLLDPFGGSGTTALTAALLGFDCSYCEVNPYLAWVADTKVNRTREAAGHKQLRELECLADELDAGRIYAPADEHPLVHADGRRGFFPSGVASFAASLLAHISLTFETPVRELAQLAVTTSLIPASNMVRRTDLRKRRSGDPAPSPLPEQVSRQLRIINLDVQSTAGKLTGRASQIGSDARALVAASEGFDLIVTSPPYLNGTNYCRNTKLELMALGLLDSEEDLAGLRLDSITAGINNVSKRRSRPTSFAEVEAVALRLDEVAYDARIPALVRLYFSDMRKVFASVRKASSPSARWLLDIGDSKFAGVHVPTPVLLAHVAGLEGWELVGTEVLRSRRSYDGTRLSQVLLDLRAE